MIDDRVRVRISVEERQRKLRRIVGTPMPRLAWDVSQFGDPTSRIRAVGIVSAPLPLRIINSWKLRHVGANPRDPLPVARRDRRIVLDEPTVPFVSPHTPIHR